MGALVGIIVLMGILEERRLAVTMRRLPLVLLAIAVVTPPLVACTRTPAATPTSTSTSTSTPTSTSTSTSTPTSTSTSTSTSTPTPTPTANPTPTPAAEAEPPPPNPKNKAKCRPLEARVNQYLDANRSCATAADCVEVRTPCGTNGVCGTYVTRGREDGLRKVSAELHDINCFGLGVSPCPSCPPPRPPACVAGKCQGVAP
jgi:hypothetical protein